jgi:hypothetical protein
VRLLWCPVRSPRHPRPLLRSLSSRDGPPLVVPVLRTRRTRLHERCFLRFPNVAGCGLMACTLPPTQAGLAAERRGGSHGDGAELVSRDRHCRICHKRPPSPARTARRGSAGPATTDTSGLTGPPARRTEGSRRARPDDNRGNWIEVLVEFDGEAATSEVAADEHEPQLPLWPIRRVTAAMKRCPCQMPRS